METYTLGYKFRIYPNATQARLIHRTLGCACFVYNHFLAVRRDQWNANRKSIGYTESSRLLTDLKKREELRGCPKQTAGIAEALRNLDRAFQNFFDKGQDTRASSRSIVMRSPTGHAISQTVRIVGKRIAAENRPCENQAEPRIFRQDSLRNREPHSVRQILRLALRRAGQGKALASECRRADWHRCRHQGIYTDSNGNTVENPKPLKKLLRKPKRSNAGCPASRPGRRTGQGACALPAHERIANIRKDFLHNAPRGLPVKTKRQPWSI